MKTSTRTVLAVAVLLAAVAASLAFGSRPIPLPHVLDALFGGGTGNDAAVVLTQRVPRTLIGLAAGAALGVAGVLMQGVTRNPMADPGLLGVNAGASLAVLVAIAVLGVTAPAGFIWFAFGGAAVAAAVVYLIGTTGGDSTPARLTLTGAAVAAGLGAASLAILTTSAAALNAYRFWSVGSLTGRDLAVAGAVAPFVIVGLVIALASGRRLDMVALGDQTATALGHNVALTRVLAIGATVLLAGSATALAGPLVFVGLVVPHLLRALGVRRSTQLVALAAPVGAALLLAPDVAGRVVASPAEVEAGFVVALIGAPVLIAVVQRRRAVRL